jgi:uncharacterized cupredoxin-like copper-binding protein
MTARPQVRDPYYGAQTRVDPARSVTVRVAYMHSRRFQKVPARRGRHAAVLLGVSLALGLAPACSSTGQSDATTTTANTVPVTPPTGTDVDVTMREWTVEPSAQTAPAGMVTFNVKNEGGNTHELVLFKTDLPIESLPKSEDGNVDETGAGVELVDEVEDLEPGKTDKFSAEVAAGKYYLVCNLVDAATGENHFGHQMYVPFTVT